MRILVHFPATIITAGRATQCVSTLSRCTARFQEPVGVDSLKHTALAAAMAFAAASACAQSTTVLPADGATGVPLNAPILLTIPNGQFLAGSQLKVTKAGAAVSGTFKQTFQTGTSATPPQGYAGWAKFMPAKALDPNSRYDVEVDFQSGAPLKTSFTTGAGVDTTPARLISSDPPAGQNAVPGGTVFALYFDKPLDPFSLTFSGWYTLRSFTDGTPYQGSSTGLDGAKVTINTPLNQVTPGNAYRFEFNTTGMTDWLGNPLPSPPPLPFTTLRVSETDGPQFAGSVPADGDTGVPLNSTIVLVFDRALASLSTGAAIQLTAAGKLVPFRTNASSLGAGQVIALQPSTPFPPGTKVTVNVGGLFDRSGAALTAPVSVSFVTGQAAETRPFQIARIPTLAIPKNGNIRVIFSRPIPALLLSLGSVSVYPVSDPAAPAPVTPYQLAADNQTLTISPNAPLPSGTYQAQILIPWDQITGLSRLSLAAPFSVTGDTYAGPASIAAVNPPDGVVDAPVYSPIQVVFTGPVDPFNAAAPVVELFANGGQPVKGTFSLGSISGTFTPSAGGLDPNADYTIRISNVIDATGTRLSDRQSAFHTASTPPRDPFTVLSSDPPNTGTVTGPNATITLTFNRPVSPASVALLNASRFLHAANGDRSGRFSVNGPVLTFVPDFPLSAGVYTFSVGAISDVGGSKAVSQDLSFRVAPPPAVAQPLTVISASPADGGAVYFQTPLVLLRFSAPLDKSAITLANIFAYGPRGPIPTDFATSNFVPTAPNEIALTFQADPGDLVTVYVNSDLRDVYGNSATPFSTTVRLSQPAAVRKAPTVYIRPGFGSDDNSNIPPTTGITVMFTSAVDRASVELGTFVTTPGTVVNGAFEWAPDSTAFTFWPSQPLPASAQVSVTLVSPAQDAYGTPVRLGSALDAGYPFQVMDAPRPPTPGLTIIDTNMPAVFVPATMPANTVIDLVFNADVPASIVRDATLQNFGSGSIVCTAKLMGTRTIRFTPRQPMARNSAYPYNFQYDSGTGIQFSRSIVPVSPSLPNPDLISIGPSGAAVPINSLIVATFTNQVSRLAAANAIQLLRNGVPVPTRTTFSAYAVNLIPLGLLEPNTEYSVTVAGFEDLLGQPLPSRSWSFVTSAAIDLEIPTVLSASPAGSSISPHSSVALTFSKPVTGNWLSKFSAGGVDGRIAFSPDLATMYFTPLQQFPPGATIRLGPSGYSTFAGVSGNPPANLPLEFRVSFTDPAGAPAVAGISPPSGSVGVPLNAQIQIRFDQPVQPSTLNNIQLFEDGVLLPVAAQMDADGVTTTLGLPRPLHQGASMRLIVSGVLGLTGTAMTGQVQSTFTCGSIIDVSTPMARATLISPPDNPLNPVISVRVNRPVNPLQIKALSLDGGGPSAVRLDDNNQHILLAPALPFRANVSYLLGLALRDLAGNGVALSNSFSILGPPFSTAPPASLLALDPAEGSTISPQLPLIALFSRPVDVPFKNAVTLTRAADSAPMDGTTDVNGGTVQFNPSRPLADGTYQLTFANLIDGGGNALPPITTSFTVDTSLTFASPTDLISTDPPRNAVGVPVDTAVTFTFSRPISASAASHIAIQWPGGVTFGKTEVQGNIVRFIPAWPLPGATAVRITTSLYDLNAQPLYVSYGFTTGAAPPSQPPQLEFTYPVNGDTVPPGTSPSLVLRFTKPVTIPINSLQFLSGNQPLNVFAAPRASEDGRTFTLFNQWPENAHITVTPKAGITDFYGTPVQPFTLQFTTTTIAASVGPYITSTIPATGAFNVPVNQPVSVVYSKPMVASGVSENFRVVDGATLAAGAVIGDATNSTFTFQPAAPFGAGDVVNVYLPAGLASSTGELTANEKQFYFRTLPPAGSVVEPVAFHVTDSTIDVRWDGLVSESVCKQAYLRDGSQRVDTVCRVVAQDQVQWTVASNLSAATAYHLVIDGTHEISIPPGHPRGPAGGQLPALESVETGADGNLRILHFRERVNPLALRRGALELVSPTDGRRVAFTLETSLDGKTVRVTPASRQPVDVRLR